MTSIVSIRDLKVGYDGNEVLHNANLEIYADDFLGVIGPNGGGKTT
ncbi:MAG: zinc ABC transporter, partial [Alistipes sp.]